MKKIICLILCGLFILNPVTSFAVLDSEGIIPVWSDDVIETFSQIQNRVTLNLDSEGAILMEEDSGTILYTKNEHAKLRPASVTKVMTILLIMEALERGDITLEDKVPCSERARKMGGSQIWLAENETLTVHEMLKAICVVSANDCCVAMSEFISGSEEAFVQKMNERAKELGMNDTTFRNCHGIDEDGHETSAMDIAIMSRELSKNHPEIHNYTKIWMDTLRDGKSQLVNTNKLVRFYAGCTGLKTGSTSLALFNLSATATRNDLKLIAVVMKGPTSQKRFDDATKLLDYGFANFSNTVVIKEGTVVTTIDIEKASKTQVDIVAEKDLMVLLNKGDEKNIRTEVVLNENVFAPLEYFEVVGVQRCYLNDELIGEINLVTNEKVDSKKWGDFFNEILDFGCMLGR
ncbi:MAG: D-alanyl-D-alanine carboxypeptidase [Clostridia bacterium]|nr:D-alanyl-D-alanine carboxypeptidase [Clostridia bacterium]